MLGESPFVHEFESEAESYELVVELDDDRDNDCTNEE